MAEAFEVKAVARHIAISPQKVRLVVDVIRGKDAGEARQWAARRRAAMTRSRGKGISLAPWVHSTATSTRQSGQSASSIAA